MKRIIGAGMMIIGIAVILTACSGTDLETYQAAVNETNSYEQGETAMRLDAEVVFNEEGTTLQEQRELSYYEDIQFHISSRYDATDNQLKYISDTYYNFGGLGFDMTMHTDGTDTLIELPIMNKYIRFEPDVQQDSAENAEKQLEIFDRIVAKWNEVLSEEDVFSGQKDYVMTDKGQIKTTTYTIHINDAQFGMLKEAVLEIIEDEELIESLLSQGEAYGGETADVNEIQAHLYELLEDMTLVAFEGEAFVDFDGRLVKQTMVLDIENDTADKGQVKTMHIEYEINYDNLGIDPEIVFPEVDEADIIEPDSMENIGDYFPTDLFN